MYINSVLSFLGAWQMLRKGHQLVLEDIQQALTAIDLKKYMSEDDIKSPYRLTSPRELQRDLRRGFAQLGWNTSVRMPIGRSTRRFHEIDFAREGVGVEITFAKSAFIESGIFFKFPLFIQTKQIHLAVLLVPMESLLPGTSSFKLIRDQLTDIYPIPLKYPFAILGISHAMRNEQPNL